jgi:hypothetical protein
MATISNTLHRADGAPQEATITIALSWDTSVSPIPTAPSLDVTVSGKFSEVTDEDGIWSCEVVDNSLIVPVDSVYKITENNGTDSTIYYVSVPDDNPYWVGDILTSKPSWEA